MFERTIVKELKRWDREKDRKPLIIRGARQVGKTTAVDLFGKDFKNYIYLNVEKKEIAGLFERRLPFQDLMRAIFLMKNIPFSDEKTLIFLDEIQACPAAISTIRDFYETENNWRVIAAGSLLETMIGLHQISFPVGRVQYMFMYPLTFEEFLLAHDEKELVLLFHSIPIPEYGVEKLTTLFHQYTLIGGMPEVVTHWVEHKDIVSLGPIYQGLITSYLDDVSKYAKNSTMIEIIRHAIESSPLEAGRRIKFQGFAHSNYRSREMGEALRTLERAMLIHLIYPTTHLEPPIRPDKKKAPRLQFLDTGIINYSAGIQHQYFEHHSLNDIYRGIIIEHIVAQEMVGTNKHRPIKPAFWVREKKQSTAEVDFVFPFGDWVIPVEVKSGKAGRLRSLHEFMDRANHSYAVRLYYGSLNITKAVTLKGKEFLLLNLPYCLAGKLDDYIRWFIEKR